MAQVCRYHDSQCNQAPANDTIVNVGLLHGVESGWLSVLILQDRSGDCQLLVAVSLSIMQWLKAAPWLVSIDATNIKDDQCNQQSLSHSLT